MAEEGVGGVDGAAEAEGGVYPVVGVDEVDVIGDWRPGRLTS